MKSFVWFVVGLLMGDLWSGWLMHIFYIAVIVGLLWTGHFQFHCAP